MCSGKNICASGCILREDCKTHVPAGMKPYEKPVVTMGLRLLFAHRLKQASHPSGDFARKEWVSFIFGENWCLFSRPPECAEHLHIQTSRNPRNFSLYNMQIIRNLCSFIGNDIMRLQLHLTCLHSNIISSI